MDLLLQLTPLALAPAHLAWLDERERARLAQISDATRAAQYLAGHCLARQLAAELSGGDAAQWRLLVADDGRRRLEHQGLAPLFASIGHARAGLAVAVGRQPLGVDLESPGEGRDWRRLARTMFSPSEVQALDALAEPELAPAFLGTWTLKEAWAKRSGRGLQRSTARRCTAEACPPGEAEAWTWPLPGAGTLALAAWPGARPGLRGVPGASRPWRYLDAPA